MQLPAKLDSRLRQVSGRLEFEATYFFPLTKNIAIVPAFYLIGHPNNFDDNPTIYVGNLRTLFSF